MVQFTILGQSKCVLAAVVISFVDPFFNHLHFPQQKSVLVEKLKRFLGVADVPPRNPPDFLLDPLIGVIVLFRHPHLVQFLSGSDQVLRPRDLIAKPSNQIHHID